MLIFYPRGLLFLGKGATAATEIPGASQSEAHVLEGNKAKGKDSLLFKTQLWSMKHERVLFQQRMPYIYLTLSSCEI